MYKTDGFGTLLEVGRDVEKVHAVVARSTFSGQHVEKTFVRTTFGCPDVDKVHAVVAGSTFGSQECQNHGVVSLFPRSDVVFPTERWIDG